MGSRDPRGLSAEAGPRITAASPSSHIRFSYGRDPDQQGSYTFELRSASDFGFAKFQDLLPWPLLRQIRPSPQFFAYSAAVALATFLTALAVPWFWAVFPATLLAVLVDQERHSEPRRAKRLLRRVLAHLDDGFELKELRPGIEKAVELDAYNDAARLLLSCALLEDGEDVAALMQLAPLRDHHPHSGEVLLVAAATYLHLNRPSDSLRMLEALTIRPSHLAYVTARHMLEETRLRLGSLVDKNELPQWGSPLAEELQPDA